MKSKGSCDTCSYYIYDAEYDTYFCDISLDEDEMYKFLTDSFRDCPYYPCMTNIKSWQSRIRQNGAGCLKKSGDVGTFLYVSSFIKNFLY